MTPDTPEQLKRLWAKHDAEQGLLRASLEAGYLAGITHFRTLALLHTEEALVDTPEYEDMVRVIGYWMGKAERDSKIIVEEIIKVVSD